MHSRCLERWRRGHVGSDNFYRCAECHGRYELSDPSFELERAFVARETLDTLHRCAGRINVLLLLSACFLRTADVHARFAMLKALSNGKSPPAPFMHEVAEDAFVGAPLYFNILSGLARLGALGALALRAAFNVRRVRRYARAVGARFALGVALAPSPYYTWQCAVATDVLDVWVLLDVAVTAVAYYAFVDLLRAHNRCLRGMNEAGLPRALHVVDEEAPEPTTPLPRGGA